MIQYVERTKKLLCKSVIITLILGELLPEVHLMCLFLSWEKSIVKAFPQNKLRVHSVKLWRTMPRKYNYIYNQLVEGRGDIIGHIAYALY